MIIKWFGQTTVQIKSKNRIVVIDPASEKTGLKIPQLRADVLAVSQKTDLIDKDKVQARKKRTLFLIDGPGEYEVKGIMVKGIEAKNGLTIYSLYLENISLAHLATIGQQELTKDQLEELNNVDILFVPIGNQGAINSEQAIDISGQIEPKILIPFYYQIEGLKTKLHPIDSFLKNEGLKNIEPKTELDISSSKLAAGEETQIVILKPNLG